MFVEPIKCTLLATLLKVRSAVEMRASNPSISSSRFALLQYVLPQMRLNAIRRVWLSPSALIYLVVYTTLSLLSMGRPKTFNSRSLKSRSNIAIAQPLGVQAAAVSWTLARGESPDNSRTLPPEPLTPKRRKIAELEVTNKGLQGKVAHADRYKHNIERQLKRAQDAKREQKARLACGCAGSLIQLESLGHPPSFIRKTTQTWSVIFIVYSCVFIGPHD